MKYFIYIFILTLLVGCNKKEESIKPTVRKITESVYASGNIESEDQYQVFSTVSGIISKILTEEGSTVSLGKPLFKISNQQSEIQVASAKLASNNASYKNNKNKLYELRLNIKSARIKLRNDSLLFQRKTELYKKNVITGVELETAELNFQNSNSSYNSLLLQYEDLIKQLKYNEQISNKNAEQISFTNKDFTIKSEINGQVYSILKKKGEFITPQIPLAILGSKNNYKIKLQVDEYDIVKIKKGLKIIIGLDSYKGKIFNAKVSKIYPIMNERSKTFLIEAKFIDTPPTLYPNLSVEANIIINEIKNAVTIPKSYLSKYNIVTLVNGKKRRVTIGLKNYEYVQILKGINTNDEITLPNED